MNYVAAISIGNMKKHNSRHRQNVNTALQTSKCPFVIPTSSNRALYLCPVPKAQCRLQVHPASSPFILLFGLIPPLL